MEDFDSPDYLYHYTNLESLALILKNHTIRFTRLDKVDDPQEMRTADSRNLAKFRFVSCWTNSAKENIPMWREYASTSFGVRIQLPVDPFERYEIPEEVLSDPKWHIEGLPADGNTKILRIPFTDLWDKGIMIQEANSGAKILHKIEYTDDPGKLMPKTINRHSNGYLSANLKYVGTAKTTQWCYQHEWRYILTIFPFDLKESINLQAVTTNRIVQIILDYNNPTLPEFYDLRISEDAFKSMTIITGPEMSDGGTTILQALLDKYNPTATVGKSTVELRSRR